MASDDESSVSLDLDSSQEYSGLYRSVEETDKSQHVLGLPPPSDFEDTTETTVEVKEESESYDDDADTYQSGTSEYDVEEEPVKTGQVQEEEREQGMSSSPEPEDPQMQAAPEPMPHLLIQPNTMRNEDLKIRKPEGYAEVYMQLFLSCALSSVPLNLTTGFTGEEINSALNDTMKISLSGALQICTGKTLEQLDNKSPTEQARELEKHGWLSFKDGKFFPVIDQSELPMLQQIITGAEACSRREERKKLEAEKYENAEAEIRAMHTFNMIVELLNAVRERYQQSAVQYQHLATAFEEMVRRENHREIYNIYSEFLPLGPNEKWNSEWFKKHTNRSTLKKFVTMPKFSEITAQKSSHFGFRTNLTVQLFKQEDFDAVQKKYENGGQKPVWQQNRDGRSAPPYASKKKEIVPDPDFKSITVSRGFDNPDDDGSLLPDSSSSNRRRSNSPQKSFGRQSSSLVGDRPGSPPRGHAQSQSQEPERSDDRGNDRRSVSRDNRRDDSTPPANNRRDPFGDGGGGGGRSGEDAFGGRRSGGRGNGGDGFEGNSRSHQVAEFGDSASESGLTTSDGEYSDDTEETKARRAEERAEKKRKKEIKRNRKPKTTSPVETRIQNRFSTSVFPRQRQADSQQNRDESQRSPSRSPPPPPRQQSQARQPQRSASPEQPVPPARQPVQPVPPKDIPFISKSTHDSQPDRIPDGLPFRPNEKSEIGQRRREEGLKKQESSTKKSEEHQHQRPEVPSAQSGHQATHPGLAPRQSSRQQQYQQEQRQQEMREPEQARGSFGSRRNNSSQGGPAPAPAPSQQQSNQQYYGNGPSQGGNRWMNGPEPFGGSRSPTPTRDQPAYAPQPQQQNRQPYTGHPPPQPQPQQQPQFQRNYGPPPPTSYHQPQLHPNNPYQQGFAPQPQQPQPPQPPPQQQQYHYPEPQPWRPPHDQYQPQYQQPPQQQHFQQPQQPYQQTPPNQHPYYQPSGPPPPPQPPTWSNSGYSQAPYGPAPPPHQNYNQVPNPNPRYVPPSSNLPYFNNFPSQNQPQQQQQQPYFAPTISQPYSDPFSQQMPVVRTNQPQRPSHCTSVQSLHSRINSVVVQSQSGNPDGQQLLSETIKFEIIKYLGLQTSYGSPVFESDLRAMVFTLKQSLSLNDSRFDIVEFIKQEMQVTVSIVFNQPRGELQFISRV